MATRFEERSLEREQDRPLSGLIGDLAQQATTLVRTEIELAKAEIAEKFETTHKALMSMAAGGAVLYAGVLILLLAVVAALDAILDTWIDTKADPLVSPRSRTERHQRPGRNGQRLRTIYGRSRSFRSRAAAGAGRAAGDMASEVGESLYGAGQSAGEVVSGIGERVSDVAAGASLRVRAMADDVRDLASEWTEGAGGAVQSARGQVLGAGEKIQEQTMRMREKASSLLREQPLVVGAFGLALGAVFGALLPKSRQEDELLGETRDRLLDQAAQMGEETLDQAKEVATSVAGAATDAVTSEAEKHGLIAEASPSEAAEATWDGPSQEPAGRQRT